MDIGAHVSTAGGIEKALTNGQAIEAQSLQIFPSAPLRWQIINPSEEICRRFRQAWPKAFRQVVFHGIYLTNLAAAKPQNCNLTKTSLVETLKLAAKLGIDGTVFHPGSYVNGQLGNLDQIKSVIAYVLAETPPETKLIYENSAGGVIGGKIEDLAWLLENSSDRRRVGVCLDTCHAFAAGYDISSQEGYEQYVKQVEKSIGLENVFCWHLNDSKFPLTSKRDRHENIGQGKIGLMPFGWILNDKRWANHSGYLEVPGYAGQGPDKQNVDILKGLRSS